MEPSKASDFSLLWTQVVAKAWQSEEFKQRLIEHPEEVLTEEGLSPPPGVKISIIEETSEQVFLTLPAKPRSELRDTDLETVVGGGKIGGIQWGGFMVDYSRMLSIQSIFSSIRNFR